MTFFNNQTGYFTSWFYVLVLLAGQTLRVEYDEDYNIYVKCFLRALIVLQLLIFIKYNMELYNKIEYNVSEYNVSEYNVSEYNVTLIKQIDLGVCPVENGMFY